MTSDALERQLGHQFAHKLLLQQALTHRSHGADHNERLEFVGDGVLNCVVAAYLFKHFGDLREGELSRLRASLVREETLAEIATELDLGPLLRLGAGEIKNGGSRRPSMLADALEAIIGAVYVDSGFEKAEAAIKRLFAERMSALDPQATGRDPKTTLQEYMQGRRLGLPTYTLEATRGEAHAQEFEVECRIVALDIACRGTGGSRRAAEQAAARAVLDFMKTR